MCFCFYLSLFEGMMLWQLLFDESASFERLLYSCKSFKLPVFEIFCVIYLGILWISKFLVLSKLFWQNYFLDNLVRGKCLYTTLERQMLKAL